MMKRQIKRAYVAPIFLNWLRGTPRTGLNALRPALNFSRGFMNNPIVRTGVGAGAGSFIDHTLHDPFVRQSVANNPYTSWLGPTHEQAHSLFSNTPHAFAALGALSP